MKKIISLFARNYDGDRLVRDEIVPGAEWVVNGEGIATEKIDGTSCFVRDGKLYKRYDAKNGKIPPPNFEPAQDPDPVTGHWPGWIPVEWEPSSLYHLEAWCASEHGHGPNIVRRPWTYELVGPAIQGNPHGLTCHRLICHGMQDPLNTGKWLRSDLPRTFEGLRAWFAENAVEGIVWWHDLNHYDEPKVKIKRKDFGLPWPIPR